MKKNTKDPYQHLTEKFWEAVEKGAKEDDCWLWRGTIGNNKYARLFLPGGRKSVTAHRFSWQIHNGPIPEGLCVCHHCDVRSCTNILHLFLGTQADNVHDMMNKGRDRLVGERNAQSKLTDTQVRDIRALCNVVQLAEKYGVSASAITDIATGKTWKHVK